MSPMLLPFRFTPLQLRNNPAQRHINQPNKQGNIMHAPKALKFVSALLLPILLAACFYIPGKFASSLDVRSDGKFAFSYKGEIIAFSGSKMMEEIGKSKSEEETFEAYCYDDDKGETRDCTEKEKSEQKKEWEAGAADRAKAKAESAKEEAEMMSTIMGFNPNDPKTIDAFIAKLTKQKGWNSVVHKGEGVFEVDYAISGTLDRDFIFPNIPDVATANPMVVVRVRKDNNVEVDAPGFGSDAQMSKNSNLLAAIAQKEAKDGEENPFTAKTDGTFTVTTNAEILTNNTEDGPASAGAKGKSLIWKVDPQTNKRPEALLKITR